MKLIFTIPAVLIVLSASVVYGQIEGGLDTTFGSGGKVTTLVTYTSGANAVALQKDGKIVAAGCAFNGTTYEFAVARYDTDGSIDTTFGLEGIDTTRLRSGNSFANGVAIEANGKIILAGKSSNANTNGDTTVEFALARYTSNGLLDSTFGTNGIDTFTIDTFKGEPIDDEGNAVVIQPDGKILVAGFSYYGKYNATYTSYYSDFALIRVDTNGMLDKTFGDSGKVLAAVRNFNDRCFAMALQKDGKIILGGFSSDIVTHSRDFALARYDTSGHVDSTFGIDTNGIATIYDASGNEDMIYSIAFEPNGKIIAGGTTQSPQGSYGYFALARFNTNGIIDSTFEGGPGMDIISFYGYDDEIRSIATDTAGRIIAAGFTWNVPGLYSLYNFALMRLDTTGAIDTTFVDSTGKVTLEIGTTNDEGNGMVIQPDGKIVMAGYAHNAVKSQFALVRYNIVNDTATPTGVVEVAIENNSLFVYPNPAANEVQIKYTLAKDETLTIRVYDLLGRLVQSVIANKNETAGTYTEMLNLEALSAGSYIINLSNDLSQSLSINLIKE